MRQGKRLVITGGIGSGKSIVSRFLEERGWRVLDADQVGHDLMSEEGLIAEIASRWPSVVEGEQVDRRALAAIVFASGDELAFLESLLHPEIGSRITTFMTATPSNKAVEVSVPRVMQSGWGPVVVVDASAQERLRRVIERGLSENEARARLAAQPGRQQLLHLADFVISNEGSLSDLKASVSQLDDWLT